MGDAVTELPVVALKPVDGVHVYAVAPLASRLTLPPSHMVSLAAASATVGGLSTVTVTVCVALQFPVVPVIVYDCVDAGLATTVGPVVTSSPVAGLHV